MKKRYADAEDDGDDGAPVNAPADPSFAAPAAVREVHAIVRVCMCVHACFPPPLARTPLHVPVRKPAAIDSRGTCVWLPLSLMVACHVSLPPGRCPGRRQGL